MQVIIISHQTINSIYYPITPVHTTCAYNKINLKCAQEKTMIMQNSMLRFTVLHFKPGVCCPDMDHDTIKIDKTAVDFSAL